MKICNKESCTGCGACINICPTDSIKFQKDEEGFNQPVVDDKTCIKCGKCIKTCPVNNNVERKKVDVAYAAVNRDNITLMNSSSGGVFTELAKYVIEKGGYVFGAAFDNKLKVKHILVDNIKDIEQLKGSKYVQSDTKKTFQEALNLLKLGNLVLFSGTPCQIAGLRNVVGNKYEHNLITIDLICHGVPSQEFFDKYIDNLGGTNKISEFKFRHKEKNDYNCMILHYKKGKRNINIKNPMVDPYYYSFLNGYIYRESCYQCIYANDKRVSDITLGDFWGVSNYYKEFENITGVSALLINTRKGAKIFEEIKDKFLIKEANIEEIKKHNHNLTQPTKKTDIRKEFFKELKKNDFNYIVKKYCTPKNKWVIKLKSYIPLKTKNKLIRVIRNKKKG